MAEKTADNFGYGNMSAEYRMKYKKMLEAHDKKEKEKKKNKTKQEEFANKLYGATNKRVYTKTFTENVEELKQVVVKKCVNRDLKVRQLPKTLEMLQKLQKKCTQNRHRCNRNMVITRYIGA